MLPLIDDGRNKVTNLSSSLPNFYQLCIKFKFMKNRLSALGIFLVLAVAMVAQTETKPFKVIRSIPVSGYGSWDYLAFDNTSGRVFVAHNTCVQVIDVKTGKQAGVIDHTPGVHGIALAYQVGKGFISAGTIDSVIVFDLKTYEVTAKIATGRNPDAIIFDPFSNRVFAFNAKGNSVTVIDAETNDVLNTIPLRGNPEYAVTDVSGNIYVNIENIGMVCQMDAMTLEIKGMFPLGAGTSPTGMSLDKGNDILFCGCSGTSELVVLNLISGQVVARVPIGMHCDGVCFMPALNEIFTSNGEGTITVIHQDAPDRYVKEQTLVTKRGARTVTTDYAGQVLYLPTDEFNDKKNEFDKNSFQLLVVSR
jgi:YVTN family beta-propeller protein